MKKQKISTLKKKLWKLVSEYIRRKHADDNGNAVCVTCGTVKHWKELDCGHFIPKSKGMSIYFEEDNLAPQCTYCNRFQHGNLIEYTRYMIAVHGLEKVDELRFLSNTTRKIGIVEYRALIVEYQEKLNLMK